MNRRLGSFAHVQARLPWLAVHSGNLQCCRYRGGLPGTHLVYQLKTRLTYRHAFRFTHICTFPCRPHYSIIAVVMERRDKYELQYREGRGCCGDPFPEFTRFFAQYDKEGAAVLDLGCAQGRDALPAARKGNSVVGVDIAETGIREMLEDAPASDQDQGQPRPMGPPAREASRESRCPPQPGQRTP